jgi:hypothetical protein
VHLFTAPIAYFLTLQFIFPKYVALPAAFHSDMYSAAKFVADGSNFMTFLSWPRPLYFETLLLAGHLGFEGSLIFLTAILIVDLALAVTLLERFVLRHSIPWWIALGALLLAMTGPGFYAQPAFDVGYHVAFLFGLLGIYAWESRVPEHPIGALSATGLFFILSALANEGFIPALVVYGAVAAFRERHSRITAVALLALPLLAVAVSFADSRITHSPFVMLNAAKDYPYRIDLSLRSLLHCSLYYLSSLIDPAFLALLAACAAGLWLRRRLLAGAIVVVAGLSLYLPYILLPNHINELYQWAPMPVLMLLVPLAWSGPAERARSGLAANVAIAASLIFAILFQSTQYSDQKNWYRVVLDQNRSVMAGVHSIQPQIARSHAILVRGLSFITHPWAQNAEFLSRELGFSGEWTVVTEPGYPAIDTQPHARPLQGGRIDLRDYDLVIVFNGAGKLVDFSGPAAKR